MVYSLAKGFFLVCGVSVFWVLVLVSGRSGSGFSCFSCGLSLCFCVCECDRYGIWFIGSMGWMFYRCCLVIFYFYLVTSCFLFDCRLESAGWEDSRRLFLGYERTLVSRL